MRIGWVVAAAILLVGCGSGEGVPSDLPDVPTAATAPIPAFDPDTRSDAQELLDGAFDQLITDGGSSFETQVELLGGTLSTTGIVDIGAKAGEFEFAVSGDAVEEIASNAGFQYRIRDTHVYGSPTFGPFDKCWFDYGDSNPLFQGDATPWLHIAVAAVSDARALGLADGQPDVLVVEVPAAELLSVTAPKMVNLIAEQLTEELVWAPAVVELDGGRYTELRFNIDETFEALENSGVDLTSAIEAAFSEQREVSKADLKTLMKYFAVTQSVTYSRGAAVEVEVPPADELMDASGITEENDADPELCAAAK